MPYLRPKPPPFSVLKKMKKANPNSAGGQPQSYVWIICLVCEDKFRSKDWMLNSNLGSYGICPDCKRIVLSFKAILVEEKKLA